MRLDVPFVPIIFAQAADSMPQSPIVAGLVALLGAGGLGALLGPYFKAKAERERLVAEEELKMRRAKHEAELAQYQALADMARSMPGQFEKMGQRLDKFSDHVTLAIDKLVDAHAATDDKIDKTAELVGALASKMQADSDVLVRAIARQLGITMADAGPGSVRGQPVTVPARRPLPSAPG